MKIKKKRKTEREKNVENLEVSIYLPKSTELNALLSQNENSNFLPFSLSFCVSVMQKISLKVTICDTTSY